MKARLIKLELSNDYRIDDEQGVLIASTLSGCKSKLSLKNCQAIELGYDLYELAEEHYHISTFNVGNNRDAFRKGFQKALEILGDKKFTEEDVKRAIFNFANYDYKNMSELDGRDKAIQSLQQTEWEVEIEMEKKSSFCRDCADNDGICPYDGHECGKSPMKVKLDAEGCLILKRI